MRGYSLRIGICDDEKYVHSTMKKIVNEYIKYNSDDIEIVDFYSGNEIINYTNNLDIIFMDIDMPEKDGIETSQKLRKKGVNAKIIMLTGKQERYREAFKINAFRFVPKPIEKAEIFEVLEDVKKTMRGNMQVKVYNSGIEFWIKQRDILYIESSKDSTIIYTKKTDYRSELSLTKWLDLLDEKMFFKCHKSYIVNLSMIDVIDDKELKIITGEKVLVSRRMKTPLLQAYMDYDVNR